MVPLKLHECNHLSSFIYSLVLFVYLSICTDPLEVVFVQILWNCMHLLLFSFVVYLSICVLTLGVITYHTTIFEE